MATYYQGKFRPKNPQKYKGDSSNIIYRSSWELKLFNYLDQHPSVQKWSSEEFFIPYISPIDGKWHRYFPDVYVEQINTNGKKQTVLIEVKPDAQTRPPELKNRLTTKGNISRRYLNEVKTWGTNEAKWKAAQEFCVDRGWTFQILTEKQLFGK
jgi:hypothetical protein